MDKKNQPKFDRIVYLFHGGGALGAYQAGVFKGLSENGYNPDWVIGTSIGAVNSAIIAGNPPEARTAKLKEFWETIATKLPPAPDAINNIIMQRSENFLSSTYTALFGQPGFFEPRLCNPWFSIESTTNKLSFYKTDELRETLLKLIDFDYINEKHVRLSMGAVKIKTGQLIYFDNTKIKIKVDHIMASCALPPGFPAIEIDRQFYWDGGVHSNTQINLLLCESKPLRYLCFMVNLFDTYGELPTNMDDVFKRIKEINYSSRHKQAMYTYRNIHNLKHAIHTLCEYIPEQLKNDPEIKKLTTLGDDAIIRLVRFHLRGKLSDLSSKDYEFSLPAIHERVKQGCADVERTLLDPPWNAQIKDDIGLVLYEVKDTPVIDFSLFEEIANYHSVS